MSDAMATLRASVQAQMDLGASDVLFDEPWSPLQPQARPVRSPVPATPVPPAQAVVAPVSAPVSAPVPPPARSVAPPSGSLPVHSLEKLMAQVAVSGDSEDDGAWELASSLQDFHAGLNRHSFYQEQSGGNLVAGQGPAAAPFMLVFHAPEPADLLEQTVLSGAAGELLTRLLASLKVDRAGCYATYFHKSTPPARIMPRHAALLRRMLAKEVELVRPQTLVFFGRSCYEYVLGGKGNFIQDAGMRTEFAGRPATVLIDPQDMLDHVENKKLTWNIHIPRCGLFQR